MAAIPTWTCQIARDFIETDVAMRDLQEQLHGTLEPDMKTPDAGGLDQHLVIEIAEGCVFEPRHQKSSADGIRL